MKDNPPLIVNHSRGSYGIHWLSTEDLHNHLPLNALWITEEHVYTHWNHLLENSPRLVLPAGESSKNFEMYTKCLEWLTKQKAHRKTILIALGGGALLDLVGFVAATYMRGIPYNSIPTTLLAQVDAAIGGKVGINLPVTKNMIGAIYPPQNVYLTADFLESLPEREYLSGLAEIVKYAFVGNPLLINRLLYQPLQAHDPDFIPIIQSCIHQKIKIIEEDEFDRKGIRAKLNFGHTIGHALEKETGYSHQLLHGEAVSIGMVYEAKLAERLDVSQTPISEKIKTVLTTQGLPTTLPITIDPHQLLETMKRDKKAIGRDLSFSLLKNLGDCRLYKGIPEREVLHVLTT
jgi:3-dehydroquinate synthase